MHAVLWTGGWDSTYRIADLVLRHERSVEPHYVVDTERPSTSIELARIDAIRAAMLATNPQTAERLRPLAVHRRDDLTIAAEERAAYRRLLRRHALGSQVRWIAALARHLGRDDLEWCVHRNDGVHWFVRPHAQLVDATDPARAAYRLHGGGRDLEVLFGSFRYPLLDLTKVDMGACARAGGFVEVLGQTWFCHQPTPDGDPCGYCNPCTTTRAEGLSDRVPHRRRLARLIYVARGRVSRARTILASSSTF